MTYSDAELKLIKPVQLGPGHYRNPFADVADTQKGFDLSRRWAALHWPEAFANPSDKTDADPFEALQQSLIVKRSGFHTAEGPHGKAYFPHTAKDEAHWETRCAQMHDQQIKITAESKPLPSGIQDKRRMLHRGD